MTNLIPITVAKTIWLVEAFDHNPESDSATLQWAFTTREAAHAVYHRGEREVRSMHWKLSRVELDAAEYANHHIDLIKAEEAQ